MCIKSCTRLHVHRTRFALVCAMVLMASCSRARHEFLAKTDNVRIGMNQAEVVELMGPPSEVRSLGTEGASAGPSCQATEATKQLLFAFKNQRLLARLLRVDSPPDVFFVCVDSNEKVVNKGQWLLNWSSKSATAAQNKK